MIVTAREPAAAERAAEEIADGGRLSLQAEQLDVADPQSVERLARADRIEPGRLDALVNNAGVMGEVATNAATAPLDDAHRTMETNLFGAWRLTQAMLPLLRRSDRGRIVNVSSGAGQLSDMNGGYPGLPDLEDRAQRADEGPRQRGGRAPGSWSTRCARAGCAPTWGDRRARARSPRAPTPRVWLATLPDDGPTGGFFRDRAPIPW